MSENSKIEWCDHTFNPWEGCTAVGPGCDNCYAEARNLRFNGGQAINWGTGAPRRRTSEANWRLPLKWEKSAFWFMECNACGSRGESKGHVCQHCHSTDMKEARPRVFCASLADVFDNEVPAQWRLDLFELIRATPHLDWLLLTKRIGNATRMLPEKFSPATHPNVWIGATVVNQAEADRDIQKLLAVPAARRFLSIEPMLGPVDLGRVFATCSDERSSLGCDCSTGHMNALTGVARCGRTGERYVDFPGVDWVICGGESGPHARPMHPDWPRSLRDQCAAAGVPFLFKQWGEWEDAAPITGVRFGDELRRGTVQHLHAAGNPEGYFRRGDAYVRRVGKKAAGRLLDGREHNGFPGSAATGGTQA